MKEPRKVQISNERQLENRGLHSLHLFIVTIMSAGEAKETLPDLVESVRRSLSGGPAAYVFENALNKAGYLDIHTNLYPTSYAVLKEEFFEIAQEFPRITQVPAGLGDLRYSLLVSACVDFAADPSKYLPLLKE
jgi:hypothetical protein